MNIAAGPRCSSSYPASFAGKRRREAWSQGAFHLRRRKCSTRKPIRSRRSQTAADRLSSWSKRARTETLPRSRTGRSSSPAAAAAKAGWTQNCSSQRRRRRSQAAASANRRWASGRQRGETSPTAESGTRGAAGTSGEDMTTHLAVHTGAADEVEIVTCTTTMKTADGKNRYRRRCTDLMKTALKTIWTVARTQSLGRTAASILVRRYSARKLIATKASALPHWEEYPARPRRVVVHPLLQPQATTLSRQRPSTHHPRSAPSMSRTSRAPPVALTAPPSTNQRDG